MLAPSRLRLARTSVKSSGRRGAAIRRHRTGKAICIFHGAQSGTSPALTLASLKSLPTAQTFSKSLCLAPLSRPRDGGGPPRGRRETPGPEAPDPARAARHTSTWRVRRGRGRLRCSPKPDPPHNLPALHTRSRPRITSALSLKNAKAYKSLHTAHRSPITDESHSMSRDICGCSHHSPRLARGRSMDYMYMCSTLHDFT